MTDTKTDKVAKALRDGKVETISIGPRAVCVTVKGDGKYVLPMSPSRTAMLLDTVGTALRREEADRAEKREQAFVDAADRETKR